MSHAYRLTSVLVSIAVAATALAAAEGAVPVRKPGLWKITTITAATGMTSIDACIGPADSIAATTSPGTCASPNVEHASDQTIVTVVCSSAGGRETTSTLFTGDFTSWYRGIAKITSDPPVAGRGNLGVTLDARYQGPCK